MDLTTDPTYIPLDVDLAGQRLRGTTVHGNLYFDVPFISHIIDNIYQGGCTNGLVLPEGILHTVSLYPWERYTIHNGIRSQLSVWVGDSLYGSLDYVDSVAAWVNAKAEDAPVICHCQAGLNRSSLVVARALMLRGSSADDAIDFIRAKRSPAALCNPYFVDWLRERDTA